MPAVYKVVVDSTVADAAPGQVFNHIKVLVTDAGGNVVEAQFNNEQTEANMTFAVLGHATYVVRAVDATNALMGDELTGELDIVGEGEPPPPNKFKQPTGVTFTPVASA